MWCYLSGTSGSKLWQQFMAQKKKIILELFCSTHYKYSVQANTIPKCQGSDVFLKINFLLFFNIKVISCFEILW